MRATWGILSRRNALPVHTVRDEEPLEAGVVFVVPVNRHVSITDSEIGLQVDSIGWPKPSHLKVGVEARQEKVVGYVEDDGRGFERASKGDGSGRGIDSMRERAELVDGAFRVSSFLGTDTKIEASIPLNAGRIGGEGSYDGGRG